MKNTKICKYYESLISEGASNELTTKEALYLELHLKNCESCAEKYSDYVNIESKFKKIRTSHQLLENKGLPSEINTRIMNNLKQKIHNRKLPRYYFSLKPIFTAASFLFLSFAFVFFAEFPINDEKLDNLNNPAVSKVSEIKDYTMPEGFSYFVDCDDVRMNPTEIAINTTQEFFDMEFEQTSHTKFLNSEIENSMGKNSEIAAEPLSAQPFEPENCAEFQDDITEPFGF